MKILVSYRGIPQSPGWATGDFVVKALRALGHEVYPYAKYYQKNTWVNQDPQFGLDKHEWDLILYMECNDGDRQYHELALARARKTVCWLFDTSYYHDRCKSIVDYFRFDHIFLANPLTIREYKVWNYPDVHYLPYACDPELHGRKETPKTCDVALVGSIRDDRVKLQKELAKHNIKLELIGGVFREAYIDALASARIVVNQNPLEGRGLLNMRFWEATAAGAWIITEKSDLDVNPAIEMAPNNSYESIEDLARKCHQCLHECPKPLEWLVLQNEFLREHSYQKRCQQLLQTVFPHG